MCHSRSARPPAIPADLLPISGGAGGADVVLTSDDGNDFRTYVALAQKGDAGVVIAPDTRGLHPFYEELAERFASAGIHAIAFDYYGRSAGVGRRAADFAFERHDHTNTHDQIHSDLATAIRHIRGKISARDVYVVGFCKGGRLAFHAAAEHGGISGVIGFYGTPAARRSNDQLGAPIDKVDRMRIPVLGLFGGADEGIPAASVDAFEKALTSRGVRHCIHTYPGAPHSFFDRTFTEHVSACDDAWRRMLGFIRSGDPAARI